MLTRYEFAVFASLQVILVAAGCIECGRPVKDSKETRRFLKEDRNRDVLGIIKSRGFEAEEHQVETRDGYILRIQRIVNPLVNPKARPKMKPVVLLHGLMMSPVDFVIDSPNVRPQPWPRAPESTSSNDHQGGVLLEGEFIDTQESPNALAFYLANRGYDVWLITNRCTIYGQKHRDNDMTTANPKFWNFSLDELIQYDLPDTIDYILNLTDKSKLAYVGHSQGTSIMFGLLAHHPRYNSIVEPFVALAPIVYISHMKTLFKIIKYLAPYLNHVNAPFLGQAKLIRKLMPIFCKPRLIRSAICKNLVLIFSGFNKNKINLDRSTSWLAHIPAGTSIKIIAQFGQWINSNRFAHFSHGNKGNLKAYNSVVPPIYELSKIKSPAISLFVAKNDALLDQPDLTRLISELPRKPHSIHNMTLVAPGWNHFDYTHSLHTGKLLNPRIWQVLKDFD